MTTLGLQEVSKRYGTAAAVTDLSMESRSGELLTLLGPSGAGKTTILKLVAGLLQPTAGDIRFDGRSVLAEPPEKRRAVLMLQGPSLFPYMSTADNAAFALLMRGVARSQARTRGEEMLTKVGLSGIGDRRPSDLSGGQQQRVALARALLAEPRLLLLDEPLANLDPELRADMRSLIRESQRERAITTIFVTHDQEEAVEMGDRIALLSDGRLEQIGPPRDFYERPSSARVAQFFGSRNMFNGTRRGDTVAAPFADLHIAHARPPDGPVVVTIRPEAVLLGHGGPENTVEGRIIESHYRGTHVAIRVAIGDVIIEASLRPDEARSFSVGDVTKVTLPPARLWIMPADET
ncbi:MAG: ABC transporter ATP-binding protein [Acidimicrobiia bacterium]